MSAPEHPPEGSGIQRLLDIVARLRGEGGCPWDREQTPESLRQYLIEESYETLDAIDSGDAGRVKEELGDVLLQVALHARIREERGDFDFDAVAHRIADKLVHRHPHVFGDVKVSGSSEVLTNWETLKSAEKDGGKESVLDGVPRHLPALQRAQRVQSRAARVGFDWSDVRDVVAKVDEELAESKEAMADGDPARIREEIGDLLFSIVNLCRFREIEAEDALRGTVDKFTRRFKEVEGRIRAEGRQMKDCTLAEMDAHWNAVKRQESTAS